MTDARAALRAELVERGIAPHEARWLIEEYFVGAEADEADVVRAAAERRLAGEPLQYIIGHWPFRGLDLDVDPRVLIPRPETEELVGLALEALATSGLSAPRLLDLGCGSGAIGLSLLDELRARGVGATLVALDESEDALAVAKRNALKHRLLAVSFVHSYWFDDLDPSLRGRFDLIAANPPYVAAADFESLDPVLRHEPYGALVAPDFDAVAGFEDVARIIQHAPEWLTDEGVLIMEHSEHHGPAACEWARRAGFASARTVRDVAGSDRFLVARRSDA